MRVNTMGKEVGSIFSKHSKHERNAERNGEKSKASRPKGSEI